MAYRFIHTCVAAVAFSAITSILTLSSSAQDQPARQTPTFQSTLPQETKPADLADFTFLTGTWQGEMNGEFVEEVWSQAEGGAMMGMFRWLHASGTPRMYELLTITRQGDDVYLRLRHFNAAMVAWEEKDAPVVLKLAKPDAADQRGRITFNNVANDERLSRIVFHQPKPNELGIDVEFRAESGAQPLNFRFTRK
ncbi:MAG TPA: DUF6265 family protein [Phycisphaerales bacterium]|nr:DUF6265 family protein [Phycisphaerales bacterium]HRQ74341.1 DUF6265 family protein [Phycisphaerales bacterium]